MAALVHRAVIGKGIVKKERYENCAPLLLRKGAASVAWVWKRCTYYWQQSGGIGCGADATTHLRRGGAGRHALSRQSDGFDIIDEGEVGLDGAWCAWRSGYDRIIVAGHPRDGREKSIAALDATRSGGVFAVQRSIGPAAGAANNAQRLQFRATGFAHTP